jgi:hypothetical protein
MAAFTKYAFFVQDLCDGKHNFSASGGNTFKVMLTNTAPVPGTDHTYSGISANELANGNGYTSGGALLTIASEGQTSGTEKVAVSAPSPTWTATGSMGPFRYAVVYNATNGGLVASFDNGSSTTLVSGQTFTVQFDATNGLFQIA